jgi:protocatechuate 3,4-dioxygenase, alpha subunit
MSELGITPSQTVGPFFSIGLPWAEGPYAVPDGTPGAVWLRGRVLDGAGNPVPDALLETWQSTVDEAGGRGFARCGTDDDGHYGILFAKPGPDGTGQAPHLAMSVFARGLLDRVVTRIYFDDEADANGSDPVLSAVPTKELRETLLARRSADGYTFDIRLQGEGETVFFDV